MFSLTLNAKGGVILKKIYIIDDDRDMVESISIVLKASLFEVASQYNDENVIENVNKYKPDLIILDVIFPENHSAGFKIAREIKTNNKLNDIPIIMLSAVNEKGSIWENLINRTWMIPGFL